MATKSILLAIADRQAHSDISQALGTEWMPTSVSDQAESLAQLEKYSFDAFLVDFNLDTPDASELLNQVLEMRPETVRFLLAYEADLALVASKVSGTYQLLPKPIEFASLKRRIEDGVALEDPSDAHTGAAPATGAGAAPKIPVVYAEVLKALESPEVTTDEIGAIIAQDTALTAEVLRLANSAYLRPPLSFSDSVEAVGSLGLETVKALIMSLRFLAEHSHLKPGYLSFERLWQHSTNVALIARDLVLFETNDRALASQAFVAGLVHDLGKVTLVTNFNDLYGRLHSLARNQPVPLWAAEKEMFGASHGEISGCLGGMWNLPYPVVEATADHHEPPLSGSQQLTPLAAIHIANVLEHELEGDEFCVAPIIDARVLNELALLDRLPVWRAALANGFLAEPVSEFEVAEAIRTQPGNPDQSGTTPTSNQLPGPATATWTTTSRNRRPALVLPDHGPRRRLWVYAGVAAIILPLLAVWVGRLRTLDEPLPINARTPGRTIARASSIPSPTKVSATVAQVAPDTAIPPEELSTGAPEVPTPTLSVSVPGPSPTAPTLALSAQESELTLVKERPPDFRLNGIIYSAQLSSAIVNGRTVYVGSQVSGATVLKIGPNQVTLEINGQPITYALH